MELERDSRARREIYGGKPSDPVLRREWETARAAADEGLRAALGPERF